MRARRRQILGWVLVVGFAIALVAVTYTTPHRADSTDASAPSAAEELVDAWERSPRATFVRVGTLERRRDDTGAAITSEDVLAQQPPRRLRRSLGGIDGRDDDRLLTCPAGTDGETGPCTFGQPSGETYEDSVLAEVEAMRSLVEGRDRVYAVERAGDDCFALTQVRVEPRARFGIESRFCFDPATGAPANSVIRHAGGVVEVVAVVSIRSTVDEADLEP